MAPMFENKHKRYRGPNELARTGTFRTEADIDRFFASMKTPRHGPRRAKISQQRFIQRPEYPPKPHSF